MLLCIDWHVKTHSWRFTHQYTVIGILLGLIIVSGCGFQLRGAAYLPPELSHTYIEGVSPYSNLATNLRQQLRANGVETVEDRNQATATLLITSNNHGRRVLAVGDNGKVREFQLYTVLSFEVKGVKNKLLLENQTITLTRDFAFDENNVLGKAAEAELLREDIEDDLARLILYRLQAIGRS